MSSKILRVFLGADLRCSHDGLNEIAKSNGIEVGTLTPGNFVIFINSKKNMLKLYAANNVIAFLKLKSGTIDLRTIAKIPEAFKASGKIDYDSALKKIIEEHLTKKK